MKCTARRLEDICSFRTGKLDSNAAVPNGQYPFFTCAQETFRINEAAFDTEAVLLGGNNAAGVYPLKYFKGEFNAYQRTYVIEPLDARILSIRFLYYALRQSLSHFQSASIGAATQYLTKSLLNNFQILLPPIRTQEKISDVLSAYDDLIENNNRRITLLEESARLLYQEWFIRLRFPGYEHTLIVGGVPERWEKKKLKSLGEITTGKTPSTKRKEYFGGNIPFIKTPDMHGNVYVVTSEDTLSDEGAETQGKKYLNKNAIIVACIGAKAGVVSLTSNKSQTNQQINAISVHEDTKTLSIFLFKRF